MNITIPQSRPEHEPDRFGFSLFLAVAVHALIIFGVGFKLHQDKQSSPTLEITLAQHQTDSEPDKADFLAQHNQQGSGNNSDKNEITTDRQTDIEDAHLQQTGSPLQRVQEQLESIKKAAIFTLADSNETIPHQSTPKQEAKKSIPTPLPEAAALEIASLKAKLDQQQQEYSKLPRTLRLTSASTKAADHAAYLRYWIDRIEAIGNNNYPKEASRKSLYGDLRLAVTILPNGSVENIEVLLSSGQRVLDQAAIRTVRLASPFAPFPDKIKQWDKLEIIRTWRFVPGNQLNTVN